MRVCDLNTLYIDGGEGGVNTYLVEKARYLSQRGDTSHFAIVPGKRDACFRLHGSTFYLVKSPRVPWNPDHRILRRFRVVKKILERESPSVVEVDCTYFLGRIAASALKRRGTPIIGFYHVHFPTFIAKPGASRLGVSFSTMAERLAWRYVRFCYKHCDRLIVSSRDIQARLQSEGLTRLDYAPLGVNLDLFHPLQRNSPRVTAAASAAKDARSRRTGDPIVILFVGRLSYEKDLDVLIRAFKILPAGDDYRLWIVGDGPVRRKLERLSAGDPKISFLGFRPYGEELAKIYASADLLANPSPNETFSLTILEAFASGLPVVSVRQGGPSNLVSPKWGELAEPGNHLDLAAKISSVGSKRRDYTACRADLESGHSWEQSFERLLEIYEKAVAARRSQGMVAAE